MKSSRVHEKSWVASVVGLGCLVVGIVALALLSNRESTSIDTRVEQTAPDSEVPMESPSESINPFIETMIFKKNQNATTSAAMLEIRIEKDGQYHIKECISGDIISKGVWAYDDSAQKITLTHVGDYPMINIFAVKKHVETPAEESIELSTSPVRTPEWELVFIASESTNVKYELLSDGDIFVQQVFSLPEQVQLNDYSEDKKDVV